MEIAEQAPESTAALAPARATGSTPTAELAECTCPDFCERDHEND
jgi:hypothetical protein